MINELDYFTIPYINKELLINTIEIPLIDILKNDNKQHNIYANIVVEYFMRAKINKKDYDELLNDGMSPDEFFLSNKFKRSNSVLSNYKFLF